jgi:hypothetical protein
MAQLIRNRVSEKTLTNTFKNNALEEFTLNIKQDEQNKINAIYSKKFDRNKIIFFTFIVMILIIQIINDIMDIFNFFF